MLSSVFHLSFLFGFIKFNKRFSLSKAGRKLNKVLYTSHRYHFPRKQFMIAIY